MRDVTTALMEEAELCYKTNTRLHSRLHEAKREIEYLRSVIHTLNGLQDKDLPQAFRQFVGMEMAGRGRPSVTHPIFRPDEVRSVAIEILERRDAQKKKGNPG